MKKIAALLSALGYGLSYSLAYAQGASALLNAPVGAISGKQTVGNVQQLVINLIFAFAAFLAVAYFMYGGVKWVMSKGDKNAVAEARKAIVASIIGMVLVAGGYFAINTVFTIIGGQNPLTSGLPILASPPN